MTIVEWPTSPEYDHLVSLHDFHGKLTAEIVEEDARDHDSPLHRHFEWDDTVAAHQHRLDQARSLIRRFKVIVHQPDIEQITVRAFVHEDSRGAGDSYSPIADVWSDPERRAAVIARLRVGLVRTANRLRAYEEFSRVVQAIDELHQ